MIPILGILKMVDDYKNDCLKQGFESEPYATFTDPKHEKPYIEIQRNQIRKEKCCILLDNKLDLLTNYDKSYEITNWNAYLAFNGVKYFYFVQDKHSSIVVKEVCIYSTIETHDIYKFLFSSNPIDLITIAMTQVMNLWKK
jgi:hypothetical protein